jgi:hypothetical protein
MQVLYQVLKVNTEFLSNIQDLIFSSLNFHIEAKSQFSKNIVFVDGVRTPFLPSYTEFKDLMAYELGRNALL